MHSLMSSTKADIMHLVEHLGSSHALAAVVTFQELGIEKYPLTSAGKVRKNILKDLVAQHFHAELESQIKESPPADDPLTPPSSSASENLETSIDTNETPELIEMQNQLIEIWSTLIVTPPSKNDSVYDFADSISLLRYCDKVWRNIGKKLYLQDFMENDTFELQAKLLQAREESEKEAAPASRWPNIVFTDSLIEPPDVSLSANEMSRSKDGPPRFRGYGSCQW